ncbi:acyl-coenzyme A synthetase/AMP-(fatty) acid ligase [Labrenzia sp. EL_126]|nr:acyl-coenzyme A synthetase/AMP-(fatty) acid ligase [Labrenzia sp. EL_126]
MSIQAWQRFEHTAQRCGSSPAIVAGRCSIHFERLYQAATGWAAKLDLTTGDRVVVSAANGPEMAAAVAGIWAKGAIPVLVNAEAPLKHIDHAISLTGANALIVDRDRPRIEIDMPVFELGLLPAPAPLPPLVQQPANLPASIIFTSGSTGLPKGVTQSAATLIDGAARIGAMLGYKSGERILCPVPFSFDYGWGQLLSTLFEGHCLVLPDPPNSFGLCAAIAKHRPTVLAGVPAVFSDLFAGLAPIENTDRSSIRLITNTGSSIPAPIWKRLCDLFPNSDVALCYGLTETYRSSCLPVAEARDHPMSIGYGVPGASLSVIDELGRECAPEEEGEVIHRGAGVFMGYWGDPEKTAQTLRPDPLWLHNKKLQAPLVVYTGDLGRKDANGRLYVHGRRDRQIKSMGVRVSPSEIEALLLECPDVTQAAIVTRPHDALGHMIVAVVVLTGEKKTALKALKRHARSSMSRYMQPRDWIVLEALPRNANGKIDYPALRQRAGGGSSNP